MPRVKRSKVGSFSAIYDTETLPEKSNKTYSSVRSSDQASSAPALQLQPSEDSSLPLQETDPGRHLHGKRQGHRRHRRKHRRRHLHHRHHHMQRQVPPASTTVQWLTYKSALEQHRRSTGARMTLTPTESVEFYKRSLARQLAIKAGAILGRKVGNHGGRAKTKKRFRPAAEVAAEAKRKRLHRIKKLARQCSKYARAD